MKISSKLAGHRPIRRPWTALSVLAVWCMAVFAFVHTGAAAARDAPTAAPPAAGTHTLYLEHGGHKRKYLLHIPARYRHGTAAALVLAFHGGGGHAEYMADDTKYGLVGKAEKEGFLLVLPNGYSKFPRGHLATWNAGACCGNARDRKIDDVGFVRAMVAAVRAQLSVDATRVFATGMSNGGMMSHRLACEAADVFRAVASVAGTQATAPCTPSRPISVLHIHARDDSHVLFGGGAGPGAFRDMSKVMDFSSVGDTIAGWTRLNRCQAAPQRSLERPGAYCETYAACSEGVSVQLCVTEDGGHSWPGARTVRRGKAGASQALDANAVIWDFFVKAAAAR